MNLRKDHFGYLQRVFIDAFGYILSDATYANMSLLRWFGGGNVYNPKTLNEKINWLKVFYRNPLLVRLADKYSVRDYVKDKLGDMFLNELIGVWDNPFEIDWSALPMQCVLKCTHGSGMNVFIKDKNVVDQCGIQQQLSCWLKEDYSKLGREWIYKDIPRRVIGERFITDNKDCVPLDYKFFCFNGEPRYIQVDVDRFGNHRRVFFDTYWKRQPFSLHYECFDGELEMPKYLNIMLEAAQKLSGNIPFVRVDFYAIPQVIFGEMTFFPGNGTENFYPSEWDLLLGNMLILPDVFQGQP